MIIKHCSKCGALINYPKRYCDDCRKAVELKKMVNKKLYDKKYNEKYDRARNPEHVKFYNSTEWKMLKEKKLQDVQYKCQLCNADYKNGKKSMSEVKLATDVHHIVEIADDFNKRLDYRNLYAVCHDCHNKIHGRFQKKKKRSSS